MARILIAEDEQDIRDLIDFTLTYAGHEVVKAKNGVEAVDLAQKSIPDLILLDVRMPKMNGYEACRELKNTEAVKDIPVVFLSANGQDTEIGEGIDAGAYSYIVKPFAPEELTRRIQEILEHFGG